MANTKKYVSLDKLSLYDEKIKKYLADADAVALKAAKDYADGLASNYEAAGNVATGVAEAKAYADTQDNAVKAYVGTIPNGEDGQPMAASVVAYVNKKTEGIASEGAMTELAGRVTQTETDINNIEKDYLKSTDKTAIEAKITAEQTRAEGVESGLRTDIDAVKADYLKAEDKTALQNAINAKADQSALDEVSAVANAAVKQSVYDEKVAALVAEDVRIAGLVSAEQLRAEGVESGLNDRLVEVESFFKLADGEQLDAALDTLVEIQGYITGEGAAADQMVLDIAANAKAIEDMDAAYKAADQTLQGNINTLSATVDTKAAQSEVNTLSGKVGALETASATHATKTELQGVSDELSAYKTAHASDYTNAQIDAAIKVNADAIAALDETYATDDELTAAINDEVSRANGAYAAKALETTVSELSATVGTKAAQSEVTTISGKVSTLEGDMAQAKTDIDAVEAQAAANKSAHEANAAAIALKADQTALNGVGERVTAIETWHANFVEVSEEEINQLFSQNV